MDPNNQPVQEPVAEQPAAAEKCETCGKDSNNGNCSGCYQPNAQCSCPPEVDEAAPASPMGGPASPDASQGGPAAPAI